MSQSISKIARSLSHWISHDCPTIVNQSLSQWISQPTAQFFSHN